MINKLFTINLAYYQESILTLYHLDNITLHIQPSTAQVSEFRGAIGQFEIDGIRVPLWNFYKNTPQCEGAIR